MVFVIAVGSRIEVEVRGAELSHGNYSDKLRMNTFFCCCLHGKSRQRVVRSAYYTKSLLLLDMLLSSLHIQRIHVESMSCVYLSNR
jgi:hypothetical protein